MEWAQIIAVLLAICLGLFLLVAGTLIFMLLRLTVQIKSLMKSAHTVSNNVSQVVASAGGIAQVIGIIRTLQQKIKRQKTKREK